MSKSKTAITYIDGFNLYWGMLERGWSAYKWLDLYAFSKTLVPSGYKLGMVRYFTTWVKGDQHKTERQQRYIAAMRAHNKDNGFDVKFGRYQLFPSHCKHCEAEPVHCANCGIEYSKPTEKRTDVNLATYMLLDCFTRNTNCIILVSGDSDYTAPLVEIGNHFPHIRRVIAFPPKRKNPALKDCCDHSFTIIEASFKNNQLPNPVIARRTGKKYPKPTSWP